MLHDIDIRAYAGFKDKNMKLNLINSIKSGCHSKGLEMQVEPDEANLEGMRVWKNLQPEGRTQQEFIKTLDDEIFMLAFVMNESY